MMKSRIILLICICLFTLPVFAQDDGRYVEPEALADPEGAFTEVDGLQIYYIEMGDTDDPTVILVHGFAGSTFTWRDTIAPLVEAGYHVVALDLPPFGLSDKAIPEDYTRSSMAATLAGLMDTLEIESATLVGHSMGGGVIAQFAIDYPQRVEKLVFVDGAVYIPPEKPDVEATEEARLTGDNPLSFLSRFDPQSPLSAAALRTFITPEVFNEILSNAYHNKSVITPEVQEGYQRPLHIRGWEVGLLTFMAANEITENIDIDALRALDVPALIIWGQEDSWVPLAVGEALANALPHATLVTYPETGHMPMEETTEAFLSDLIAFLEG